VFLAGLLKNMTLETQAILEQLDSIVAQIVKQNTYKSIVVRRSIRGYTINIV